MNDATMGEVAAVKRFQGRDYVPGGPVRFAWAIHDESIVEPLCKPIAGYARQIAEQLFSVRKKEIATRLQQMQPVIGNLPEEVVTAGAAYVMACEKRDAAKTPSERVQAGSAICCAINSYHDALELHREELKALHRHEVLLQELSDMYGNDWLPVMQRHEVLLPINIVAQLECAIRGDGMSPAIAQRLLEQWGPALHALFLTRLNQQGYEPCPVCKDGPCDVRRMIDCPACGGRGLEIQLVISNFLF